MPTKKQVIEQYGQATWDRMCETTWLDGITVKILPNGEHDIPESDISRAYRAVKGEKIDELEWD